MKQVKFKNIAWQTKHWTIDPDLPSLRQVLIIGESRKILAYRHPTNRTRWSVAICYYV